MGTSDELVPLLKKLRMSGVLQTLELRIREAVDDELPQGEFLVRLLRDEVERRLDLVNTLKRKYGRDIEDILNFTSRQPFVEHHGSPDQSRLRRPLGNADDVELLMDHCFTRKMGLIPGITFVVSALVTGNIDKDSLATTRQMETPSTQRKCQRPSHPRQLPKLAEH